MSNKPALKMGSVLPRFVADDNGYAFHKLAWFDAEGKIQTAKYPSLVEIGHAKYSSAAEGLPVGTYITDDKEYSCQKAPQSPIPLRNGDYPTSTANRVLLTHSLTKAGLLNMPLKIAVTLPFRDFYRDNGAINDELRKRTAENFKAPVVVSGGNAQPQIQSVNVYAEALSAWFDWALNENGQMTEEAQQTSEEMAVIDIGGSTTDICCMRMDESLVINNGASGTQKIGVLDARNELGKRMRDEMIGTGDAAVGHDEELPGWFIDAVLERGTAKYCGKQWDFKELRSNVLSSVGERITAFIKTSLGNLNRYQVILIVGGGAIVFAELLKKHLPMAEVMDEFANARGALKYLRFCAEE